MASQPRLAKSKATVITPQQVTVEANNLKLKNGVLTYYDADSVKFTTSIDSATMISRLSWTATDDDGGVYQLMFPKTGCGCGG